MTIDITIPKSDAIPNRSNLEKFFSSCIPIPKEGLSIVVDYDKNKCRHNDTGGQYNG